MLLRQCRSTITIRCFSSKRLFLNLLQVGLALIELDLQFSNLLYNALL